MANPEEIKLRELYVKGTPQQRFKVATDRVQNCCGVGPDLLVAAVSAVEGFARAPRQGYHEPDDPLHVVLLG